MILIRPISLLALMLLLALGCSGGDKGSDNNDNDQQKEIQRIENIISVQQDIGESLVDMLATMDTTATKDSLVKLFESDTANVLSASANTQGVVVEYKNGMRGGVLLDPLDMGGADPVAPSSKGDTASPTATSIENHRPVSNKTIFLNPHYSERQAHANPLIAQANAGFAKTGYSNFEVVTNNQCTVEKFASLSGYGVVHFYSHGMAWPNSANIKEVFLMTGEIANAATTTKYFSNIKAGRIPIVVYNAENRYFVSPSFVAHNNSFHDDTTFVYLGFCYSWLGNWQDTLVEVAGAGACVGFDWSVFTSWNAMWAQHLYHDMCDTSEMSPMELSDWRDHAPRIDNTYWDAQDNRWVSIWDQGNSDLVMWNALRITAIDPPEAQSGSTVKVKGMGFGESQGNSVVKFGNITVTVVSWSDTEISVIVPELFVSGNVTVTVGGKSTNNFPFRTAVVRLVLDQDSLFRSINDTVLVHAQVTGTLDTTVYWRVLPYGNTPAPGQVSQITNNYVRVIGGYWFAGLCRVECVARADTTARDTVTVAYSVMHRLKSSVFFWVRLDAAMLYSISCSDITYDPTTVFVVHNWSGEETSPKPVWSGDIMTIKGSWEYGQWPYHDTLYVRAQFNPLGDSLRSLQMINYRYGRDLSYRQWEHRIDVRNVPFNFYSWTETIRVVGYQASGQAVQSHVSSFLDYYLEHDMQENCVYERTATTANWNSTTVTPRFELKLGPVKY